MRSKKMADPLAPAKALVKALITGDRSVNGGFV
jgi:hypothetical protein